MRLSMLRQFFIADMFYQLGRHVFIRNIHHSLYLWDKYNDTKILGDEIAFAFAKHLSYQPKPIESIAESVASEFSEKIDPCQIQEDAKKFYGQLVSSGLVFSGENEEECNQKASSCDYSSYASIYPTVSEGRQDDFYSLLRTPALIQVMIEITKICNERCLHCYIPHKDKNSLISYCDIIDIIQQCKEIGTVVEFKLSGGECMTHPDFKKIIRQIKDAGFALTLLTNLTLLDDETIGILKDGSLSSVQVSLFSLNPDVHDTITAKSGSLETTLRNLERLKSANIPVSIATQVMELNKDSIADLFAFCEKNGFRFLCDWTIVAREDGTTGNLDYRVKDVSVYEKLCNTRLHYDPAYGEEMQALLELPLKASNTHLCNAGMNCLQIDTDLNIHPCPGWDISIGNLKEISIQSAWENSPVLENIRKTVLGNFPKCAACDNRNICHICMAEAYNESNGRYEMPEYECEITKVLRDAILKIKK